MQTTENYNLVVAELEDVADIESSVSVNFPIIDRELKRQDNYMIAEARRMQEFMDGLFNRIYPVGSVYTSTVVTNPRDLFGVGTWERIGEGRCLIDAGTNYAAGSMGGESSHTLTVSEMPSHNHTVTINANGEHTHTRGTMNITGSFSGASQDDNNPTGAFYVIDRRTKVKNDGEPDNYYGFDASRAWTGETSSNGSHVHTTNVTKAGNGEAMNNMQPYLAVYIWKRVS